MFHLQAGPLLVIYHHSHMTSGHISGLSKSAARRIKHINWETTSYLTANGLGQ